MAFFTASQPDDDDGEIADQPTHPIPVQTPPPGAEEEDAETPTVPALAIVLPIVPGVRFEVGEVGPPPVMVCPVCCMAYEDLIEEMLVAGNVPLVLCNEHIERLEQTPSERLDLIKDVIQVATSWYAWPPGY